MKRKLLIFSISAIFVTGILFLIFGVIGQAGVSTANATTDTCADSDGGLNYKEKGTVTTDSSSYTDTCVSGNDQIVEGYCKDDNTTGYDFYTCPAGCSSGECKIDLNPKNVSVVCSADNNNGVVQWTNPDTNGL